MNDHDGIRGKFEEQIIAAARRAQDGDKEALDEMKRITKELQDFEAEAVKRRRAHKLNKLN